MNEPEQPRERRNSPFYAFCSLILPGLGQLLQKRPGEAIGFFVLFLLTGFLPVLIVSLLFRDRFVDQPLRIHLIHMAIFGGLYFLFLLAIFWSVMDAVRDPQKIPVEQQTESSEGKPNAGRGPHTHFTIVELLVVIVIIGVLIALLLPAVPAAREPARRMQCSNRLKQIVIAFQNYHDEYGTFPPAYTADEGGRPLHSWRVLILPYLENKELYEKIRLDEPWDSEYNRQFHSTAPFAFRCPSGDPRFRRESNPVPESGGCHYSVIDGRETAFFGTETKSSPPKGLCETIFLVERRTPVNWMNPLGEITFETACKGINVDAMGISSYHPGGASVAFGDGAVRFLADTLEHEKLLEMLMTDIKPEK